MRPELSRKDACAGVTKLKQVVIMHNLPSETIAPHPKISIGLVVYNGVEHIRGVLDSIVRQSYKNIELIVVDGGSQDGTNNILKEYSEHISVQISEPDKGIFDAMNKACSLASGDWLIFLGCDDMVLDTLENISKQMTDPDVIYYGDVIIRSSGSYFGGAFTKHRLMRENFCHQSVFYPRAVYRKHSYNLNYPLWADYHYNLTLMGLGIRFVYTGVVVSIFNDKGRSSAGDANFKKDRIKLIATSFGHIYVTMEIVRGIFSKYYFDYVMPTIKLLLLYPVWKYLGSQLGNRKPR
jgi:glycosyltransferase involved in cell wall biosynthesis